MPEKRVVVRLVDEAKEVYLDLQKAVRREREEGVASSFNQTLLRSIDSKIALLKANYDYGIQTRKSRIPKKYLAAYGVANLWKVKVIPAGTRESRKRPALSPRPLFK